MVDQSMLMFVEAGDAPGFNINVTIATVVGGSAGFDAHIHADLAQLRQQLASAQQISQANIELAGFPATVVEQRARAEGVWLRQKQIYLRDGERLIVITSTSTEEAVARATSALDSFVGSLKRRAPECA
jgi:hypothetical protein